MSRPGTSLLFVVLASVLNSLIPACLANNAARLMLIEDLRSKSPETDVYARVPKAQRHLWENPDGRSINETLQSFADIPVDVTVAVKLIGFEGDGINHIKVNEGDLLRFLRALHLDMHTASLHPELSSLVVRPRIHFQVSKATTALTQKVAGVLTSAVFAARQVARSSHLATYVPHTVVDDVLAEEERAQAANPSHGHAPAPYFTLYLLNLEPPSGVDYLYTYKEDPSLVAGGNWSEFRSCPGALYVSDQTTHGAGFAWVDLGAAPHAYGPLKDGPGQVFPHNMPHAANFQHSVANIAILPDIAALTASAIQHLAWPPLQHSKLALPRPQGTGSLVVQLVHIHDTLAVPPRSLDGSVIQQELNRVLQGSDLTVEVRDSYISFSMCDLCVNAYTSALRVQTQRQQGSTVMATSGQILDSLVLQHTLAQYSDVILAYAGVHDTHDVLPVFLYDLSMRDEALLLDGVVQAAWFPGMVVAVATRATSTPTRFSCGHTHRYKNPSQVTRPVLGAVLRTVFGLPHIAVRYNPASGTSWNYLWDIGSSPFGSLSGIATLSAATISTARRNLALVELDHQASRIAAVLQGLSRLAPNGKWKTAVTDKETRNRLIARINVASIKLELATTAMSQGRNSDALRMARHMSHDATAMERLALHLEKALLPKLQCRGGTDWTVLLWPPAGSMLALLLAVWWRSRGARLRAEARYDKIY